MQKPLLYISIIIVTLLFTLNYDSVIINKKESAIHKIVNYAKKNSNTAPTYQNYTDANISGIAAHDIDLLNQKIVKIETNKGDEAYKFNADQNYAYTFKNSNAKATPLKVKHLKISLHQLQSVKNSSLFLKITLDTTPLGQYFTPKVFLEYKGITSTHTLEPGTQGIRYLNISNLKLESNTTITLRGQHITIKDQEIYLIALKKPSLTNKRILILSPHPDDAEIAAFGLYSKYHNNTYIVTITAGDAGEAFRYSYVFPNEKKQYLAKGKKRTIDSITVPLWGGILPQRAINLGYFDSRLYTMEQNKTEKIHSAHNTTKDINTFRQYNTSTLLQDLNSSTSWNSLVTDLTLLLNKIKPDIIISPHPRLDKHSDHKLTTKALFQALKQSDIKKGKLFLYINHSVGSEYYPYGDQQELITLPPEYVGSIYFNNIYSHPLNNETKNNKLFALESMSDLRFTKEDSIFKDPCQDKLPIICKNYSYVRRSVRSNELFFIIDIDKL